MPEITIRWIEKRQKPGMLASPQDKQAAQALINLWLRRLLFKTGLSLGRDHGPGRQRRLRLAA